METLALSTELCPLVSINTYETLFSPDFDDENESQYIQEHLEEQFPRFV